MTKVKDEEARPTKPMNPIQKIEKLTVEMDETTTAADFFLCLGRVMNQIKPGQKIRATVFVQIEEVDEESE